MAWGSNVCLVAAVTTGALLTGAGNTFTTKVLLNMECPEECGTSGTFNKPIYATLIAFCGMAACVLLWWAERCGCFSCTKKQSSSLRPESSAESLLGDLDEVDIPGLDSASVISATSAASVVRRQSLSAKARPACGGLCHYNVLWFPATLDVIATGLQTAAMLFISAAVNSTMRGSLLVFTALFNRALRVKDGGAGRLEWMGIALSTVGVAVVGVSAILNDGLADVQVAGGGNQSLAVFQPPGSISAGSATWQLLAPSAALHVGASASASIGGLSAAAVAAVGVALAVGSNVVMALQVAAETRLIEAGRFAPNEVNAVEGVMGVALCVAALGALQGIPAGGDGAGHVEDSASTLCCLRGSAPLLAVSGALLALFMASTTLHMLLSQARGANFRGFVLVARALVVFVLELGAAYLPGPAGWPDASDTAARYGQRWQRFTPLEVAGFALLCAGGAVTWVGKGQREAQARLRSRRDADSVATPRWLAAQAVPSPRGGGINDAGGRGGGGGGWRVSQPQQKGRFAASGGGVQDLIAAGRGAWQANGGSGGNKASQQQQQHEDYYEDS